MAHRDRNGRYWKQDSTPKNTPLDSESSTTSNSGQTFSTAWTNNGSSESPTLFPSAGDNLPIGSSGYQYAQSGDDLGISYYASPGVNSGYIPPLQNSGDVWTQSRPRSSLTNWGPSHASQPSSISYSSTEPNNFSPPTYTISQYLEGKIAYSRGNVVSAASSRDYAVNQRFPQNASELQGQASSRERPQPSTYTATFDARTMTEVTAKQTEKTQKKKSGKLIWENRNATCDKHKKQKKECNPNTCPGNKIFQQRNAKAEELLRGSTTYKSGYGDDFEAVALNHEKAASTRSEGESLSDLNAANYDEPTIIIAGDDNSTNGSTPENPQQKGKGKERSRSSDLEDENHLNGNADAVDEPTDEDIDIWTRQLDVDPNTIPRMVPGGASKVHIGFGTMNPVTNFEYVPVESSLSVFEGALEAQSGQTPEGLQGYEHGREDHDGRNSGGPRGDSNDRSWDRYDEYGDYFKGHDKDWEDGKGPDGSSGNEGGGYPKPQGGYYSFSSRPEELDDMISRLAIG